MIRICIAGSGAIVPTALDAMRRAGGIEVVAIYAREYSRAHAEALADSFGVPKVYTDYEQMLAQEQAEFVYVALVNSAHYAFARLALLSGKSVIVEKPFCMSGDEAQLLVDLAHAKGLFVFEAVTLLHHPNMATAKEMLPRLGRVRLVQCNYSQRSSRYDRLLKGDIAPAFSVELGGGALRDINDYCVNFVVGLFGMPQACCYFPNIGPGGIDTSGVAILRYEDFQAVCTGAKDSDSPCYCTVQGDQGWLRIDGKPNEMRRLEVCLDGEISVYEPATDGNRMVEEFRRFTHIFLHRDFVAMDALLATTLDVMRTIDQLLLSAQNEE